MQLVQFYTKTLGTHRLRSDNIYSIKHCLKKNAINCLNQLCAEYIKKTVTRLPKNKNIIMKNGLLKILYRQNFLTSEYINLPAFFKATEITIGTIGQVLLNPNFEVEAYLTSLKKSLKEVIKQSFNHGANKHFHSEIKTEFDLKKHPSRKYKANNLLLLFELIAYNLPYFSPVRKA
jgi:hypothetical protein